MSEELAIGQVWHYRALKGFEDSRIVIGAIDAHNDGNLLICVSILHAPVPRQNKQFIRATIPFLVFSREALEATLTIRDETRNPDLTIAEDFAPAYAAWKADPEWPQFIEVPFPVLLAELCKDM